MVQNRTIGSLARMGCSLLADLFSSAQKNAFRCSGRIHPSAILRSTAASNADSDIRFIAATQEDSATTYAKHGLVDSVE